MNKSVVHRVGIKFYILTDVLMHVAGHR